MRIAADWMKKNCLRIPFSKPQYVREVGANSIDLPENKPPADIVFCSITKLNFEQLSKSSSETRLKTGFPPTCFQLYFFVNSIIIPQVTDQSVRNVTLSC